MSSRDATQGDPPAAGATPGETAPPDEARSSAAPGGAAGGGHPWGEPALRVTLLPRDTNPWGAIFGGIILSYIDLAGGVQCRRHSAQTFVTVAMREVVFHQPVYVGDLVSFYTRTVRIGRTSITVKIMVEVERFDPDFRKIQVTEAEAVYVAVDDQRRPVPVVPVRQP